MASMPDPIDPDPVPVMTDRLRLVPCTLAAAQAVLADPAQAAALLDARIPLDWPLPDLRGFLDFYARLLRIDPGSLGWGIWLVIRRAEPVVIGDVGFKGRPNARGAVDIGYSILPAYRRQGYAFEAARALVDWAFTHRAVAQVTATCLPDNLPSIRVLEKLGMQRTGLTESGMVGWVLARPAYSVGDTQ